MPYMLLGSPRTDSLAVLILAMWGQQTPFYVSLPPTPPFYRLQVSQFQEKLSPQSYQSKQRMTGIINRPEVIQRDQTRPRQANHIY